MAVMAQMFAAAHTKKGRQPPEVKDFIYRNAEEKKAENHKAFFSALKSRAKKNG